MASMCHWMENVASTDGGAVACYSATEVTIVENNFTYNKAMMGGGLYGTDGCMIVSNDTEWWYNGDGSQGGGIAIYEMTSLELNDNTLKMNNATHGGGVFAHTGCSVTAVGSTWDSNTAVINGGGIAAFESCTVTLHDDEFMLNTAQFGAG
eukprot:1623438-Rhodomonas_salina.1